MAKNKARRKWDLISRDGINKDAVGKWGEFYLEDLEDVLAQELRGLRVENKNMVTYIEQFVKDIGWEYFGKDWAKNELETFRKLVKKGVINNET